MGYPFFFFASDLPVYKEEIWQAGNVKIAVTPLRQTLHRSNVHPARKNVNFWTTPATRLIVRAMAWTNALRKNNIHPGEVLCQKRLLSMRHEPEKPKISAI
jgi:hypothetical protein